MINSNQGALITHETERAIALETEECLRESRMKPADVNHFYFDGQHYDAKYKIRDIPSG